MRESIVLRKLRQPYIFQTNLRHRWITCIFFSAFVFLFLLAFQPFGIHASPLGILKLCLGYGLTTFVIMTLVNIALLPVFPKFLAEENWTVGKEIGWSILNIALIGLGNALFNSFIGNAPFSIGNILVIELYTLAVGIFPVSVSVLLKETRLNKKYSEQSEVINKELKEHLQPETTAEEVVPETVLPITIQISSETGNEKLEIIVHDFLFIQSSDNYIEVHYKERNTVSKKLLRNSLKSVSESLGAFPNLFRCHKSFLVNLEKVSHVSGNAQGYKLHLQDSEIRIPVSRQHNEEIKKRLVKKP